MVNGDGLRAIRMHRERERLGHAHDTVFRNLDFAVHTRVFGAHGGRVRRRAGSS